MTTTNQEMAKMINSDCVNHPAYYQHIKINGQVIEATKIIEGIVDSLDLPPKESFWLGCAIKYILRSPYKENFVKDINKSITYLERLANDKDIDKVLARLHYTGDK